MGHQSNTRKNAGPEAKVQQAFKPSSSFDTQRVHILRLMLEVLNETISFDAHRFFLLLGQENDLSRAELWHYTNIVGTEPVPENLRRKVCSGKAYEGWVLRNKKMLRVSDKNAETRTKFISIKKYRSWQYNSYLVSPFFCRDNQVCGIVTLANFKKNAFSQYDEYILSCVCNWISRYFKADRSKRQEVFRKLLGIKATLLDRKRELSETLEIDKVLDDSLRRVLELAVDLFGIPGEDCWASLRFLEPKTNELCFQAFKHGALSSGEAFKGLRERLRRTQFKIDEPGIGNEVLRTAKPVIAAGRNVDPVYFRSFPQVKSHLSVPLISENSVYGTLSVASTKRGVFDKSFQEALSILACQASVFIRNARRYSTLKEINKKISAASKKEELLSLILDSAMELAGTRKGAILTWDDKTKELVVEATQGLELVSTGYRLKRGMGITMWAMETGKTRIIPDVTKVEKYVPGSKDAQSEIAVPIIYGKKRLGVLDLESSFLDFFSQEHKTLLEALADQASLAIANVAESIRELERIREICTMVSSQLDLKKTLKAIVAGGLQIIGGTANIRKKEKNFYIMLLDEGKETLILVEGDGRDRKSMTGRSLSVRKGIMGLVVRDGKPYISGDVDEDRYYEPWFEGIKSKIAVPLIYEGEARGALSVESVTPDAFGSKDLHLLTILAEEAVVAIENAKRFGELNRWVSGMMNIGSTLDEGRLLELVVKEVRELFRVAGCSIFLLDTETERFKIEQSTVPLTKRASKPPYSYAFGQGFTGWVGKTGETLNLKNMYDKAEWKKYDESLRWSRRLFEVPGGKQAGPFMAVAIKSGKQEPPLGVIRCARLKGEREFSPEEQKLLETFAIQLSAVIENVRNRDRLDALRAERYLKHILVSLGQLSAAVAYNLGNRVALLPRSVGKIEEMIPAKLANRNEILAGLAGLKQQTHHIRRLLRSLVDLFEQGGMKAEPIGVNDIIQRTIDYRNSFLLPSQNIKIKANLASHLPKICALAPSLTQLFLLILDSAIARMPPKGGDLTIGSRTKRSAIEISFEDTGKPISIDDRRRIFGTADVMEEDKGVQTLGLWLAARSIEDNYGGQMNVRTTRGKRTRTTVEVVLPVATEVAE